MTKVHPVAAEPHIPWGTHIDGDLYAGYRLAKPYVSSVEWLGYVDGFRIIIEGPCEALASRDPGQVRA